MIEKFAPSHGTVSSEFLELNHTSKTMVPVPLSMPNFGFGTLGAAQKRCRYHHAFPQLAKACAACGSAGYLRLTKALRQ
ncbi:MAG: hypothetical protein J0I57_04850 [Hyphomicrobium sp.]|nr:hypothetical protein [Hyphomicrobium sp.]